ncbi:hypothetical protein LTR82_015879 [Friedmanniomyces endolithicus]|uniref:Uncharacterized protein n=1 Tax=Friedmanniomyces endolithicus TaxID=329885 RepID=A0AAN6J244_9PEZI|nr:hypothetical protein LTR82_015879 [Friedmanniomyces endolithicus]
MAYPLDPDDYPYDPPRRRPSPRDYHHDYRRSAQYLTPQPGNGLHRTRSTGNAPAPNIYIYNDQIQDAQQRSSSPYPVPAAPQVVQPAIVMPGGYPYPAAAGGAYPAAPPERRGRGRLGDEIVDELAYLELRDLTARSRSRGRSDVGRDGRQDYYEWELERKARELDEERQRQAAEREWEVRRLREEGKRRRAGEEEEAERKRTIAEYEEKRRRDVAAAKEAEVRYQEKMEREKREQKEEETRMREKIKRDEAEAKEKEKREYDAFLLKQKEKAEKEKAAQLVEKAKFEREMRKRLEGFGAKHAREERSRSRGRQVVEELEIWRPSRPVYPKVHRDFVAVETLTYYNIPYEVDRDNPAYLILRREMTRHETDVLFEHTRRLRAGDRLLLIEAPKKEEEKTFAWYRKKSGGGGGDRSRSRGRVGILERRVV